jgi:hypothetical protein
MANYCTKLPAIFEGYLEFLAVCKFLNIYSMICRGTPNDLVRNPDWETLL